MVLLDISIVNVALPAIRTHLPAPATDLQWIISGYALAFGLVLVPAGRLGDMKGRRRLFVVGLAVFTVASAACGAAPSSGWLVLGRLLQGVGGGLLTAQISALIQQLFHGRERGIAFGSYGTTVGVSSALGPLLGGLLIQALGDGEGWRFVFYVNLPLGLIAIPVAWRLLAPAEAEQEPTRHDLDPFGVLLLASAIGCLLVAAVEARMWPPLAGGALLATAAALAVAFVAWERRYGAGGREPVVDLALFRLRSFSAGTALITAYFAGFSPLLFVYTLHVQEGLGYNPLQAGLASAPFAVGTGIAAMIGGRAVHRYGRPLVALGLAIVAVGYAASIIAVQVAAPGSTGWATAVPFFVAGFGGGLVIAPSQTLTLEHVPVVRAGTGGALLQTGQQVGFAIGVAVAGAVFFAQIATGGDVDRWRDAYASGVLVCIGFLLLALIGAFVDIGVRRRSPVRL